MDNTNPTAPVIPAGTQTIGGVAYNPLQAAQNAGNGQAVSVPNVNQAQPVQQQNAVQPTPQDAASGQPQAITFEELAAQKGFKSADDLAKAYTNLEQHSTRVGMGLSELIKIRGESSTPQQPSVPVSPQEVQSTEDAVRILDSVVEKHTRPLKDQLALQELFYNHPDARQLAPEIAKIVKENPGVSWDIAYKAAKSTTVEQQALQAGRQQAYQDIQTKQAVNVQPAKAAPNQGRPLQEIISDPSVPFSEVQRIMRERFSQ